MEIWSVFLHNVQQTRPAEWVSTVMQVASVWYAAKNKILVYPTGMVGVAIAAWLYFFEANPPLYADALLNIYYFILSVYGWYNWVQKKNESFVYPVQWCTNKERLLGSVLFLFSWLAVYCALINTNSNTPVLDSLVSSTAVTSMWWMAKRKMENWIAWIISNLVAIPLNFYKGFMLFTVMYVLFLGMAIMGFLSWRKMVSSND